MYIYIYIFIYVGGLRAPNPPLTQNPQDGEGQETGPGLQNVMKPPVAWIPASAATLARVEDSVRCGRSLNVVN